MPRTVVAAAVRVAATPAAPATQAFGLQSGLRALDDSDAQPKTNAAHRRSTTLRNMREMRPVDRACFGTSVSRPCGVAGFTRTHATSIGRPTPTLDGGLSSGS